MSTTDLLDWSSSSSSLVQSVDSIQDNPRGRDRSESLGRFGDGEEGARPAIPPKPVGLVPKRRESVERNIGMAIVQQKEELPQSRSRSPSSPIHLSQLQISRSTTGLPSSPLSGDRRNSGKELHSPPASNSPRRRPSIVANPPVLLRQGSSKSSLSISSDGEKLGRKDSSEHVPASPQRGSTPPTPLQLSSSHVRSKKIVLHRLLTSVMTRCIALRALQETKKMTWINL